ncbi:hypothetical protein FOCG_17827 [Fusarium oxysporum f. sp. radicis-lycopersici 26381]|nr:hypothetical protein FOCG_17827 [Fusarium oxysporum f. sp. radicis-lycopersici 26381]
MATLWPTGLRTKSGPTDYREHAPNLSNYLQKALSSMATEKASSSHPVDSKSRSLEHCPSSSKYRIRSGQIETNTAAESIMHEINGLKTDFDITSATAQQTMAGVPHNADIAREG